VNQGRLIHTDYFVNHMPLIYYLTSLLTLIAQRDLWLLRVLYLFALFLWTVGIYFLCSRYISRAVGGLFVFLLATSMTVYWGHMILAETIIAYACVTLTILILYKHRQTRSVGLRDAALLSVLIAAIALSSLGFIFVALFFYAWIGVMYLRQQGRRAASVRSLGFAFIMAAPYLIFGGLLLVTGGFYDFILQNYHVNVFYYSRFVDVQPDMLRSLTLNLKKFFNDVDIALTQSFGPWFFQAVLPIVAVGSLVYLWLYRRDVDRVAFFVPTMIFLNVRAVASPSWLNDFHNTPYIVMSLFAASIALVQVYGLLRTESGAVMLRPLYSALVVCVTVVTFQSLSHDFNLYFAYLTRGPIGFLSSGPSAIARTVNDLTTPEDYVWVGPYEIETVIYLHARPASQLHFVMPYYMLCGECRQRILDDFARTKPKIVVWEPRVSIHEYNTDLVSSELLTFLRQNYFVVTDSRRGGLRNFYFLKEERERIMAELAAKGYLPE
jgi:hypothetical protein